MMTLAESMMHVAAAAAISAGMIGVGFGVVGPRTARRVRWPWLIGGWAGAVMTVGVALTEMNFAVADAASLASMAGVILLSQIGGALLFRVGLRGRFVGDHPHCRRCGFDLFGKPSESDACNECGASLAAPRATVIGVRQRRAVPLVAGAFVSIVAIAIGASAMRVVVGGGRVSAVEYAPTWWLARSAFRGPYSNDAAAAELERRLAAGTLSDADVARVADAVVGLKPGGWQSGYARGVGWVLDAWTRGRGDAASVGAIVRRCGLTLRMAAASPASPLPFEVLTCGPGGPWTRSPLGWTFSVTDARFAIDGVAVPHGVATTGAIDPWWQTRDSQLGLGNLLRFDRPPPAGPAELTLRATLTVRLDVSGRTSVAETFPVVASARTTIVPGLAVDFGPEPGVPDPAMEAMTALVTVGDAPSRVRIALTTTAARRDFVGDVIARSADGVERPLGEVYVGRGVGEIAVNAAELPEWPFALVLRPVPGRGAQVATRLMTTYQQELVIDADRVVRGTAKP